MASIFVVESGVPDGPWALVSGAMFTREDRAWDFCGEMNAINRTKTVEYRVREYVPKEEA